MNFESEDAPALIAVRSPPPREVALHCYRMLADVDVGNIDNAAHSFRYRYFDGPTIYPFGHGISYTTFDLEWSPTQPPAAAAGAAVIRSVNDVTIYSVVVKNTGATYAADEVVLAFFKPTKATIPSLATTGTPVVIKQLFGFEKVHLEPGASTTLNFTVPASTFGLADHEGHTSLHPGEYQVIFSRGCVDCSELAAKTTIEADAPIRLKTFRKWW